MSKKHRKKIRLQDGISLSNSGMGSSGDNTTSVRPGYPFPQNFNRNTPFGMMGLQYDQYWANMYKSYWEARKIVNIPAGDMTREGWEYESNSTDPEDLKKIKKLEDSLGFHYEIYKALVYERLYGGGLVFFGIRGDAMETTQEPLDMERIGRGDLAFVRAIPSFQVNSADISTNPLSPNYQRPEWYQIRGQQVHRSRVLVFSGTPLDEPYFGQGAYLSRNNRLGFGESVLQCLYSEIQDAQGVRQSVSHLLHKLSVMIFKAKGIRGHRATKQGNIILGELENIMQMASNYRGVLLDTDDSVETYSSQATSAEGLIITYLQVLSAASDIPATRFIGQAPGGLNATGESDLRNYYDRISSDQTRNILGPLTRSGQIMARSALGSGIEDLTIKFNPLWQMSDKESAEIRQINATVISSLVTADLMMEEDAQKELVEKQVVSNKLTPIGSGEVEPFDLELPELV